jgi:hypothetical protein
MENNVQDERNISVLVHTWRLVEVLFAAFGRAAA